MQENHSFAAATLTRGRAVGTWVSSRTAAALPAALTTGLSASHLSGLDGLRAIAAFLVVYYHAGFSAPGGLGVLMFFVLSGFLITWLLLKEHERTDTISLRLFYVRRSLRIFPAFYGYAALMIGVYLVKHHEIHWPQTIASLFYVNNYYQALFGDPDTGFSHTWSLGIEEQFYLLWPMLFVMFATNLRKLGRWLAVAVVLIWTYRAVARFVFGVGPGYAYEAFEMRADHLAVGCLMAIALRAGLAPRLWRALCAHPALALLTGALLVASSVAQSAFGAVCRDSIGFIVDPLLTAALIAQVIAFRTSPLWRWLNWPLVRFLGTISYSVYLYQQLMVGPAMKALASQPAVIQLVGVTIVVAIAASASYFLIERPFLKLKDRFQAGQTAARPALGGA